MIFPLILVAGAIGGIAYAVSRKKNGGSSTNTNPPGRLLPTGVTVKVEDGKAYLDITSAFDAFRWASNNAKSKGITQDTLASKALPLIASALPGVDGKPIASFRIAQLPEPNTDEWDQFVAMQGETTWGQLLELAQAGMQSKGIA